MTLHSQFLKVHAFAVRSSKREPHRAKSGRRISGKYCAVSMDCSGGRIPVGTRGGTSKETCFRPDTLDPDTEYLHGDTGDIPLYNIISGRGVHKLLLRSSYCNTPSRCRPWVCLWPVGIWDLSIYLSLLLCRAQGLLEQGNDLAFVVEFFSFIRTNGIYTYTKELLQWLLSINCEADGNYLKPTWHQ